MNTLTVYTKGYHVRLKQLKKTMGEALFEGKLENMSFISFAYDDSKARHIVRMMENIIIDENPVVKNSQKLCSIVRDLVFKDHENDILANFNQFTETNNELVLEGYIKFRMWEYSYAVNVTLYSIIKKLNLPVSLNDK